jgi:FkbM family methyltransferase
MDLHFNIASRFTRWVTKTGTLQQPFVLIDVGVQAGEHPRWHLLGDHLVVHGFDPIEEVIDGLRQQNARRPNRHYHWLAAGSADGERNFYFNATDPFSSSFYPQGKNRFGLHELRSEQERPVKVRRLDGLLAEGAIPPADFLKCDVEGFEKEVLLGAPTLLRSALAVESESNFGVSPAYRRSHFGELQAILLEAHFLIFDLAFDRAPRASYVREIRRRGRDRDPPSRTVGKPSTLNVLFARDPIDERDRPENYTTAPEPLGTDRLIKLLIIMELYGLNDIALDTAERFSDLLDSRMDIEKALDLLADPFCVVHPLRRPRSPLAMAISLVPRQIRRRVQHLIGERSTNAILSRLLR